jgi:hypothetical protein
MRKPMKSLLILLFFGFSGCGLTVPNLKVCSAAGTVRAGAMCSTTISREKSVMSLNEYLDFLEPQSKRPNPLKPDDWLPERSGAVCMSSEDMGRVAIFVEQACRKMGSGACTPEVIEKIASAKLEIDSIKATKGFKK